MGGTTAEELEYSNEPTRIAGQDELYAVDVFPATNKNRMAVQAVLCGASGIPIASLGDKLSVTTSANDGFGVDAFGRLRVAEASTLFTFIPRSGKHTDYEWDESLTGAASVDFNDNYSTIDLKTTTASGDKAIRQTYQRFVYTPGKSNIIILTCNFNQKITNNRKRVGLFDDKDGWFFELKNDKAYVVIRSNIGGVVNDYPVEQANWNFDKMDGTGSSGITIDWTKAQILVFDYQWLGVGRVRFGIVVDGVLYYVHYANHANHQTTLYSQHPHVPFRSEIENLAAVSQACTFKTTCFSLACEGGERPVGKSLVVTSGTTEKGITNTEIYLFSVSLLPSYYRHLIEVISMQFNMSSGTKPTLIKVYSNTILTNPSWVNAGDISRKDISATGFTNGKLIMEFFVDLTTTSIINLAKDAAAELKLGAKIDGTPINMTVTAQTLGGNGNIIYAAFAREYV
jgi:hypothetical protein